MKTKNSRPHLWGLQTQLVSVQINSQTVHMVCVCFPPMVTGMNSNKTAHENIHSYFLFISRENYMVSFLPRYWAEEIFMLHTCCYIFHCPLKKKNPKSNEFCKFCFYVCFMGKNVGGRQPQSGGWLVNTQSQPGRGAGIQLWLLSPTCLLWSKAVISKVNRKESVRKLH